MTISRSGAERVGRVPEVWGRIPKRNVNFTGREPLLDQLHEGLSRDVTAVLPHALHGFGGVGKTQVAIEYAYRYRPEYDVVWWIPADQPLLVRSALAGLAPHLGLQSAASSGAEEAAGAVLEALRRGEPYSRWLLIYDNADQPEDLQEVIPSDGPGHVLITSRNHRWQGVVDTLPVDVFSRDESKAFLRKRAALDQAAANRLAEELGDLPLALEQAGAMQMLTGISVDEYLRLLKERTNELLSLAKPSEYPHSMTAVYALSVEGLRGKLPEAVDLLRACAFFGPEPIPRDVFVLRDVERVGATRLDSILHSPIRLSQAINELGRFALAVVDGQARTIQVHRLVQALLREELPAEEQERYRHDVHLLLARAAPQDADDADVWDRYGELIAHILPSQVAQCDAPSVRLLARDIGYYLLRSGNYATARVFVQTFIDQWTKDSGPGNVDVLVARRLLGTIVREMGRYREAHDLDRATMDAMIEALGADHEETLILSSGVGADLRAAGDFRGALELDEDLRERTVRVLGPLHRYSLQSQNNLALDYGLNSNYIAARDLHERTYQQQRASTQKVGEPDILASWSGLARAVRLCGDFISACAVGEEAYAYGIQALGPEHPWTLRAARDLSIARRRAGDHEGSLELAQEVHSRLQLLMGDDHPEAVAAAINLSNAYRATENVEAAFDIGAGAVGKYGSLYGSTHPYTHACASNLAVLQRLKGEPDQALATDRAALDGLDERLGRDHHYSLTCAINLASDLAAVGEAEKARAMGEDTLRRLRSLLGTGYPLEYACLANLAFDADACGDAEAATAHLEEARGGFARSLGLDHPDARFALVDRRRMDCDFDPPPI